MKNLGQFFDVKRFMDGKKFVVTANEDYKDFQTKNVIGRTVEVAISEDKTKYAPSNTGNVSTNLFEKMRVKVINDGQGNYEKVSSIQAGTSVVFDHIKKAVLWVNTNGKNPVLDLSIEVYTCLPESEVEKKDKK